MNSADLQLEFGGRWDGGDGEFHGLIAYRSRRFKVELHERARWICSIFDGGACLACEHGDDPAGAVRAALSQLDQT